MSFDGKTLGEPQLVLAGIPKGKYHNGGRITFGPDGMLYIGTGDAQNSANAQNRDSLGGKILRVTPEGKPAPGNPFGTPVFSMGHRNVQGLWFDSKNRLWVSEFGDAQRDELNLIVAGKNYGWPTCEGTCGDSRFVNPKAEWPVARLAKCICIVGDVVFMAPLRGARLWRIPITGTDVESHTQLHRYVRPTAHDRARTWTAVCGLPRAIRMPTERLSQATTGSFELNLA